MTQSQRVLITDNHAPYIHAPYIGKAVESVLERWPLSRAVRRPRRGRRLLDIPAELQRRADFLDGPQDCAMVFHHVPPDTLLRECVVPTGSVMLPRASHLGLVPGTAEHVNIGYITHFPAALGGHLKTGQWGERPQDARVFYRIATCSLGGSLTAGRENCSRLHGTTG